MFKISKSSDYGLLLIEYLFDKGDYISLSEIIEKTGLPKRFLARIASKLVSEKILESKEGKIGGYKLTKKIGSMSLFDYLKIFEDFKMTKCADDDYDCPWEENCRHKNFFSKKLSNNLINYLKSEKLLKIIKK